MSAENKKITLLNKALLAVQEKQARDCKRIDFLARQSVDIVNLLSSIEERLEAVGDIRGREARQDERFDQLKKEVDLLKKRVSISVSEIEESMLFSIDDLEQKIESLEERV